MAQASFPSVTSPPVQASPAFALAQAQSSASAPGGTGFVARLPHNRFAALTSPTQMIDPSTHRPMEQAETVDSYFTFEFSTRQDIPPHLSNHSKPTHKMYIGTVCHSAMIGPPRLPPIHEICVSTSSSTQNTQVDIYYIGIADSGAINHFFCEKKIFPDLYSRAWQVNRDGKLCFHSSSWDGQRKPYIKCNSSRTD
jgi:hypothetical protein